MEKTPERFQHVLDLIRTLRGEKGCPWDRKQTIQTLTKYVHQEFQELAEALDAQAPEKIQEEMGDLFFLLLFVAEIGREKGHFSIDDVFEQVEAKMIGRHPHVFGEVTVAGVEGVKENWKKIKAQEKLRLSQQTLAERMPRNLPALQQAIWVLRNVENGGSIGDDPVAILSTMEEQVTAVRTLVSTGNQKSLKPLIGSVFFSLVAVSRLLGLEPQTILREAIQRFLLDLQEKALKPE